MNIFSENPKDWLDLQNKVAYILESCGYTVETPKQIRTARGEVEIDVYASDSDISIVCQISPMCFMLQNEEHEEIGWSREYIDEIICSAEKKFERSFPAYYDYFGYVNNQLEIIVARIEFIYGIKIL